MESIEIEKKELNHWRLDISLWSPLAQEILAQCDLNKKLATSVNIKEESHDS